VTVQEAIEALQKMPNKEIAMLVDCPYCGRGHQLEMIKEAVILQSRPGESRPGQ